MSHTFRIYGEPVRWSAPHIAKRNRYVSPPHIPWVKKAVEQLAIIKNLSGGDYPINRAVALSGVIWLPDSARLKRQTEPDDLPISTPDIDNWLKPIQDALQKAGIVKNDSRFVWYHNVITCFSSKENEPGAALIIQPVIKPDMRVMVDAIEDMCKEDMKKIGFVPNA